MTHVLFFAALLISATLFALLEVQIEGPDGWAVKLPTWRKENFWTRIFYGGKPLTGYHLYSQLFIAFIIHLPFLAGMAEISLKSESLVISFMTLFWITEDFIWFVLNPAFGIKKFKKECVWWHAPAWWWIMPRDYWVFTPAGLALYYFART